MHRKPQGCYSLGRDDVYVHESELSAIVSNHSYSINISDAPFSEGGSEAQYFQRPEARKSGDAGITQLAHWRGGSAI